MSRGSNYKPIPVSEAKRLSFDYDKSIVMIIAYDGEHTMMHTTTYGTEARSKQVAASLGEIFAYVAGADPANSTHFEDYRLTRIAELEKALNVAVQALRSYQRAKGNFGPELAEETADAAEEVLKRPLSVADRADGGAQ